jgi:hypothetical protein
MKYCKFWILLLVLLKFYSLSFAQQSKINIIVLEDSTKHAIPGVTVYLQNGISFVTDFNGRAQIPFKEGDKIILQLSHIGYRKKNQVLYPDTLKKTNSEIIIYLMNETKLLNEVLIKATKNLISLTNEKIVYSISKDTVMQRKFVLEAFNKLPFTTSINGKVEYYGGSKKILFTLNSKRYSALNANPIDFLRGLKNSLLERIEIIEPAPLRYLNEGYDVVFNLVTKEGNIKSNAFSSTISKGNLSSLSSFSLSGINRKFDYSIKFNLNQSDFFEEGVSSVINKSLNMLTTNSQSLSSNQKNLRFSSEIGYNIDTLMSMSLGFNFRRLSNINTVFNLLSTSQNQGLAQDIFTDLNSTQTYADTYGSINKKSKNKKTNYSLSYLRSTWENEIANLYSYKNSASSFIGNSRNSASRTLFNTIQGDFSQALKKGKKLEASLKISKRSLVFGGSGKLFYSIDPNEKIDSLARINTLIEQSIYSGKLLYSIPIKKLRFLLSSNIESFQNIVTDSINNNKTNNTYFNFLPELSISYLFKNNSNFFISSKVDIQRPGAMMLNPFIDIVSPLIARQGSTEVNHQKLYITRLEYRIIRKKYSQSFELYNSYSPKIIVDKIVYNSSTQIYSTAVNEGISNSLVFYSRSTITSFKNMYISFSTGIGVNTLKDRVTREKETLFFYTINSTFNYFNTPTKINSGMIFFLNSNTLLLNGRRRGTQLNDIFFSRSFIKNKLIITLNISDPFRLNSRNFVISETERFFYKSDFIRTTRNFLITAIFNISDNKSYKKASRTSTNNNDIIVK